MDVVDVLGSVVGTGTATLGTDRVTVVIPLTVVGGDDGYVDTAAILGNAAGPTDCVPDGRVLGIYRLNLPLLRRTG